MVVLKQFSESGLPSSAPCRGRAGPIGATSTYLGISPCIAEGWGRCGVGSESREVIDTCVHPCEG